MFLMLTLMFTVSRAVPETPEIKNVYSTVIQNYRYKSVPIICVEWTVSNKPL